MKTQWDRQRYMCSECAPRVAPCLMLRSCKSRAKRYKYLCTHASARRTGLEIFRHLCSIHVLYTRRPVSDGVLYKMVQRDNESRSVVVVCFSSPGNMKKGCTAVTKWREGLYDAASDVYRAGTEKLFSVHVAIFRG